MAKRSTPKKRLSTSRGSCRYKIFRGKVQKRLLGMANLTLCSECKEPRLQHTACPTCGQYRGRKVIDREKQIDKITKVKA